MRNQKIARVALPENTSVVSKLFFRDFSLIYLLSYVTWQNWYMNMSYEKQTIPL